MVALRFVGLAVCVCGSVLALSYGISSSDATGTVLDPSPKEQPNPSVVQLDKTPSKSEAHSAQPSPSAAPREQPPLIALTPEAAMSVKRIIKELGVTDPCHLRVRIVAGGCCGFLHKLDLDPVVSAEDHTFVSSGVPVVIWKRQIDMLRGTRVGYGVENGKAGFTVKNLNFEGEALKKWLPVLQKDKDAK
jgi:iron-sulfur cluster insertion protein